MYMYMSSYHGFLCRTFSIKNFYYFCASKSKPDSSRWFSGPSLHLSQSLLPVEAPQLFRPWASAPVDCWQISLFTLKALHILFPLPAGLVSVLKLFPASPLQHTHTLIAELIISIFVFGGI